MLLVIDNYDSFTYNLVQYFGEMGVEMRVVMNDEVSIDDWHAVVATNLTATFLCTREAFALMKRQVPRGGPIGRLTGPVIDKMLTRDFGRMLAALEAAAINAG